MIVLRPLLLAVVLAIAGLGAGPAAPAAAAVTEPPAAESPTPDASAPEDKDA